MAAAPAKAPEREIGTPLATVVPSWGTFGGDMFGKGTNAGSLDREYVPELRWPFSVKRTYPQMGTDSQLDALMRGTTLPISRYVWWLDANGARPQVVDGIAADFNLPLSDQDPGQQGRAKNRFSFARHRDEALDTALRSGHAFYQQFGTVTALTEGGDGLWHLRKLSPRPPWTIQDIRVADDGGLLYIKQGLGPDAPEIPVDWLVAYVWNPEPGSWLGRSMFRACYREWLIKDRLLRVDALNHEKGGGVWWGEAHKDATPTEKAALAELVGKVNALNRGDIAVPQGDVLHLERPGGTGNSVIGSINRHDEAMARSFLLMLIQLGQTQTGSRAVGDNFTELWQHSQQSVATWFRDVFNEHVLEDWVDWNYGPDEEFVPRLTFTDPAQVAAPLPNVTLDPATQAALDGASAPAVAKLRVALAQERARYRSRLQKVLPDLFNDDELHLLEGLFDEEDEVEHQLHTALARPTVRPVRTQTTPIPLPDRPLHRQPNEHEVRAQTDFKALDAGWQSTVDQLIAQWQTVRAAQIAELSDLIASAGGDLPGLAAVEATAAGGDLIASKLTMMASLGAAEAVAEARKQGVAAAMPTLGDLAAELKARAVALEQLLSRSLSEAAARKAVQLTGGSLSAGEVADAVRTYLGGLTDAYLADQFGGAVNAAQNAGRLAAMDTNGATSFYASELLDQATCDPCASNDGKEYVTAEEAAADYPAGGYFDCDGGPRCRGTIVATYDEVGA